MVRRRKCRNIVDVGTGPYPTLFYMFTTLRIPFIGTDVKPRNVLRVGPCRLIRDDIVETILPANSADAVLCISTLEHITHYDKAVSSMKKILIEEKPLLITVPFNIHTTDVEIVRQTSVSFTHCFGPAHIDHWISLVGEHFQSRYFKCWTGEKWRVGDRLLYPEEVSREDADMIILELVKR